MAQTTTVFRPVAPGDVDQILALINDDRLPGQPTASPQMLTEALAGRSAVGVDWWAELQEVTTEVAVADDGSVTGVVSYAIRPRDGTGLILWMHTREDTELTPAVLDHALNRLGERPIEAFPFATALGLGLEALPIAHRPVTGNALADRGFTGTDLWRYLRTQLHGPERPTPPIRTEDARRTLQIRENDRLVGEAVVGMPVQGIGVLWWVGLEPEVRELDLDKALLGSALEYLAGAGAQEVIAFVSSADAADGDVVKLYERAGFVEVDQLYGFRRDHPAPMRSGAASGAYVEEQDGR